MRHDGVTFDPAAPACDMTASLLTQRPRHATCRGVRDACQVCQVPGLTALPRQRPSGTPAKFARGVCGRRRIWPGTCRGRVSGLTSLPRQRPGVDAQRTGMRHAGEVYFDVLCTLSSRHLCDRDLVRLRGQSSAGKQCVSIHNATCFSWGNIRMPVICLRRCPHYKSNCRLALRLQTFKRI